MIIQIPKSAQLSKVKINNEASTSVSTALNGHQTPMDLGAQFYQFDLNFTLSELEIREFDAFIANLNGRLNTFELTIPKRFTCYDATLSGTVTAKKSLPGSTFLMISGAVRGNFMPGDYIQLGNSSKLYMVTSYNANSGKLDIAPRLRKSIADGTPLQYKNIVAELRLNSDSVTTAYKETHEIAEIGIKAREAF